MAKYTYIKRDIQGQYAEFAEPFNTELYNNIGTTYDDYLNNMWVLLSSQQVAFHEEHPTATVKEVWDMQLHEKTLAEAKRMAIRRITDYDKSTSVNEFEVKIPSESAPGGYISVKSWLTQQERSNYRSSIDSAKLLEVSELSLFIGETPITLPTNTAEMFLASIQLYADACFIVTKNHKNAVNALTTVQEVEAYNYRTGYPEKLVFTL